MRYARWYVLRYRYTVADGSEHEGMATAQARQDLEHLDRDDLTILYLDDDPGQSIPNWDG